MIDILVKWKDKEVTVSVHPQEVLRSVARKAAILHGEPVGEYSPYALCLETDPTHFLPNRVIISRFSTTTFLLYKVEG